jgi:hypothetical protein
MEAAWLANETEASTRLKPDYAGLAVSKVPPAVFRATIQAEEGRNVRNRALTDTPLALIVGYRANTPASYT